MKTMTFKEFNELFQASFKVLTENCNRLFVVNADVDHMWELYLDSFPADANRMFRKRREMDCSCCRHFVRKFGNVVGIIDNKLVSVWDFKTDSAVYQPVVDALSGYIHSCVICDVFHTKEEKIGVEKNVEWLDTSTAIDWHHFCVHIPDKFIYDGDKTEGQVKSYYRAVHDVFKRSLRQISKESIDTVLELIDSDMLYRGKEWKYPLMQFASLQEEYNKLTDYQERENFVWDKACHVGDSVARIANHSIGVLLNDLDDGNDIEDAVRRYEFVVAPENYKRPKAIFTKKMLEEAKEKIKALGFMDSLPRRHATLSDISANDILFINRSIVNAVKEETNDPFADMEKSAVKKPVLMTNHVTEMSIYRFIHDILPLADSIDVLFEKRLSPNLMSLIAPQNREAPSMFKWNNGFAWAYAGNMTDSSMKQNVQEAGGKVDGDLRFSIQWNDTPNYHNGNDLDAHCVIESDRIIGRQRAHSSHIYFASKYDAVTKGQLDVDIRYPSREGKPAVENITWPSRENMTSGYYRFYVHNYAHRGGKTGFKAEIEFDGYIYAFEYNHDIPEGKYIEVATVMLDRDGHFTIKPSLPYSKTTSEIWNMTTETFIPVSAVMFSPNYWVSNGSENPAGDIGTGSRHVFFTLKDCKNPEEPNGFYNEFLRNDLMEHKRVFEALGERMKVAYSDDQLSGLGFCLSRKGYFHVRVTTNGVARVWKIIH